MNSTKKFNVKQIFIEPSAKSVIKDKNKIKKMYHFLQPAIFITLYLLYFVSYIGRKQLAIGFSGAPGSTDLHPGIETLFGLGTEVILLLVWFIIFVTLSGILSAALLLID